VTVRAPLVRSTVNGVSSLAAARPARARLGRWPYDDRVAHLVLLDHHMVPTGADIEAWIADAAATGARAVRTGALFPNASEPFLRSGFDVADTLILLQRAVPQPSPAAVPTAGSATTRPTTTRPTTRRGGGARLRRLRPSMLHEAAEIDRRSFSSPWANDSSALAEIMTATPHHRSRSVHLDGRMVAFAISGRAETSGYVQRLAVDPSARRRGFARLLLDDALHWMARRAVTHALVNTAADNVSALRLYESAGFERRPGALLILERTLR
jgi:ribosomal-protein-alanine N-acetyltransferase